MDPLQLQQTLLDRHGLRVETEMSRYIARQLNRADSASKSIIIIAGDARTGIPLRKEMAIDLLTSGQPSEAPSAAAQGELFS